MDSPRWRRAPPGSGRWPSPRELALLATAAACVATLGHSAAVGAAAAAATASCHRDGAASRPELFAGHAAYRRSAAAADGADAHTAVLEAPDKYLEMANDYGGDVADPDWSASAWINAEAGQVPGAVILGYYDSCRARHVWKLHLLCKHYSSRAKDCHLAVSVFGDTLLHRKRHCTFGEWFKVGIVKQKDAMALYYNDVLVDQETVNEEQIRLQASSSQCSHRRIIIGDQRGNGFRGMVANLTIAIAKATKQGSTIAGANGGLTLLDALGSAPLWISKSPPHLTTLARSSGPERKLLSRAPTCGKTVCDDPMIAKGYMSSKELQSRKTIRCHIVNLRESDGSNPSLTAAQIRTQTKQLQDAFSEWNIGWEFTVVNLNDSALRRARVMMDCEPDYVGDGTCQSHCDYDVTGRDGGDCSVPTRCPRRLIGNGACDAACNSAEWKFDGGDCCAGDSPSDCYDPLSANRGYATIDEVRMRLGQDDMKQLVIVPVHFMETSTVGIAGFPWDKKKGGFAGDVIVSVDHFGSRMTDTVIHEIGHVLGLWHVHRGVSELTCHDECLETAASFELGDLVEDTPPARLQTSCSAEAGPAHAMETETCGIAEALTTSLHQNYMSYANGSCIGDKHFTAQQAARMHCYLDLVYGTWTDSITSAIPTAPKVTGASLNWVSLEWLPPLKRVYDNLGPVDCTQCTPEDGALGQYVAQAYFTYNKRQQNEQQHTGSATSRVTGPPDSPSCQRSQTSWNPFDHEGIKSCTDADCRLTLEFDQPVLPHRIFIWILWFEKMGQELFYPISKIEYITEKNEVVKVSKDVLPPCDVPYTAYTIDIATPIKKLRLHLATPDVSIDAAYLTSRPGHRDCVLCPQLEYIIERSPGFSTSGAALSTTVTSFRDNDVKTGGWYEYTITPAIGGQRGRISAVLKYQHTLAFCGDGALGKNESCDDGNIQSGDGCDFSCNVELHHTCSGSPSRCFSTHDLVHPSPTPEGFKDVWSSSISMVGRYADPQYIALFTVGPPPPRTICSPEPHHGVNYSPFEILLKVEFETPVVAAAVIVYLSADGITADERRSKEIGLTLKDAGGQARATVRTRAICRLSPLLVGVEHDLSKPFFKTKSVELALPGASISVSALGLRAFTWMDPVEQLQTAACSTPGSLYNVGTGRCTKYDLCTDRPSCPELTRVANGDAQCTGHAEGHRCSIVCRRGFTRRSAAASDVVCSNGSWTGADVDCVPVDCGPLEVKWAAVHCPNGTLHGSLCAVKCTAGDSAPSSRQGPDAATDWTNSAYCQHSGQWTAPAEPCAPPTCPTSKILADPASAKILSPTCLQSEEIEAGGRCTVSCNSGYHVRGQSVRERTTKMHCSPGGQWIGDQCQKVVCASVEGAQYQCSDEFHSGSVCSVTCPRPSTVSAVIACQSSGRWNASLDSLCSPAAVSRCRAMRNTDSVHFDCTGSMLGSLCRPSCINKLEQVYKVSREYPVGSDYYKKALKYFSGRYDGGYGGGGSRSSRASVHSSSLEIFASKLICTASGEWFPPPEDLRCL